MFGQKANACLGFDVLKQKFHIFVTPNLKNLINQKNMFRVCKNEIFHFILLAGVEKTKIDQLLNGINYTNPVSYLVENSQFGSR